MPYHINGHKAKAPAKKFHLPLRHRLGIAATGLVCILVGIYRQKNGPLFGHNWLNMPLYPITFITVGVPALLCALTPTAWLEKVAKRIVS
jgi:hypothetical protein